MQLLSRPAKVVPDVYKRQVKLITSCTRDGHCTLTVKDNGIGIPKDAQSSVFERFYRVDKSRSKACLLYTSAQGRGIAELFQNGETVLTGQHHIQNDQFRPVSYTHLMRAMCLTIASPRPVPPVALLRLLSTR